MNLPSKTKWFDLPFSDVDLHATKKKIYVECFWKEVFDDCGNEALSTENLVAKLDNLTTDDDEADVWEILYARLKFL